MNKKPLKRHTLNKKPLKRHTSNNEPIKRFKTTKQPLKEAQVPEKCEISMSYVHEEDKWDQNNIIVNNIFSFQVALDIIRSDEDLKQQNVEECRHRND